MPTLCDTKAYNASWVPANQVHASPILPLATCGQACCPAGFQCQGNTTCVAITSGINTAMPAIPTQTIASVTSSSTSAATTATAAAKDSVNAEPVVASTFSAAAFAAGFVPGIVLGMILLAAIVWGCQRRRTRRSEKTRSIDQLTALSPGPMPRPQPHMRSISEPVLANDGHRTDFLRSSPTHDDSEHAASIDTIEEESSSSDPEHYEPRPLFEFSPSPMPRQSPIPAHMKRGTLSYTISPIRQLRTKKSLQSLRRHAGSPLRSASQRQRSSLARSNTSLSTETIQILMTPDQHPEYLAPASAHTRSRSPVASSIYPDRSVWTTPSRQATYPQPAMLGSPYSYQPRDTGARSEHRTKDKRVTTFSSLMERAGLRKEDLLPGPLR